MREYKIGDYVISTTKLHSCYASYKNAVSLYQKVAKIIAINHTIYYNRPYLLEFKEYINGHDGLGVGKMKGKDGYCWWYTDKDFKIAIDYLKFKKWVKGI